jgi:hypothetical protein
MMPPIAYLITYGNGHTVVQNGEDAAEAAESSVAHGFATRRDLDGGVFELTSTEDGRARRYEPVSDVPPDGRRFREMSTEDGWNFEDLGIIPSSLAARLCAKAVSRRLGSLWYLASGEMVLLSERRQLRRYVPVGAS